MKKLFLRSTIMVNMDHCKKAAPCAPSPPTIKNKEGRFVRKWHTRKETPRKSVRLRRKKVFNHLLRNRGVQ